jgi:hypothetical protein
MAVVGRQLGIPRFAELYVRGFLSGGGYDGIPLEINAYDLCGKFERSPRAHQPLRSGQMPLVRGPEEPGGKRGTKAHTFAIKTETF